MPETKELDPKDLLQRCYRLMDAEIDKLEQGNDFSPREYMISLENLTRTLISATKEARYASVMESLEDIDIAETQELVKVVNKYLAEPGNFDKSNVMVKKK